jgi:hypothetical protein
MVSITAADRSSGEAVSSGGIYAYQTPMTPGHTRLFLRVTVPATAPPPPLAARLMNALVWPDHAVLSDITDGDVEMLHPQEHALAAAALAGVPWSRAYFMATAEDVGVAAARRWVDTFGGGGAFDPALPLPPQQSRRELRDRWAQHAATCPQCRAAGERAAWMAHAAPAAGVLAAAAAVGIASTRAAPRLALAAAVVAAALGAAGRAAAMLSSKLRGGNL